MISSTEVTDTSIPHAIQVYGSGTLYMHPVHKKILRSIPQGQTAKKKKLKH